MAKRADGTYTSTASTDPEHRALRAEWAPEVAKGHVICRRVAAGQCRASTPFIQPGTPWDLGHPDLVCGEPTAPEHEGCNRATATHKAAARKRPPAVHPSQLTRPSAGPGAGSPSPPP